MPHRLRIQMRVRTQVCTYTHGHTPTCAHVQYMQRAPSWGSRWHAGARESTGRPSGRGDFFFPPTIAQQDISGLQGQHVNEATAVPTHELETRGEHQGIPAVGDRKGQKGVISHLPTVVPS